MKQLGNYTGGQTGTSPNEYGTVVDESSAGAQDGTPIQAGLINDAFYGLYALLVAAGVTPSGSEENTTDSDVLDAVTTLIASTYNPFMAYAHFTHEEASGTDAGTITAETWTQRTINTTKENTLTSRIVLGLNSVSLADGTWRVRATATFNSTRTARLALYDGVAGDYIDYGLSCSGGRGATSSTGEMSGVATIDTTFTLSTGIGGSIRLQSWHSDSAGTEDMGAATGITDVPERYVDFKVWKIG